MKTEFINNSDVADCEIEEALEFNEVYIVGFNDDPADYTLEEVHEGDYYIGGDGYVFVNDSNIGFQSTKEVKDYYDGQYKQYFAFEEELYRDEFLRDNFL